MSQKNDFQDDFEFKPLTSGLGFHKKVQKLENSSTHPVANQNTNQTSARQSMQTPSANLNVQKPSSVETVARLLNSFPATDFIPIAQNSPAQQVSTTQPQATYAQPTQANRSASPFTSTLPRPGEMAVASRTAATATPVSVAMAPTLTATFTSARTAKNFTKAAFVKEKKSAKYVSVNFGAIAFDSVIVIGMLNLFVAAVLFVTETRFSTILSSASHDAATQLSLIILVLSIHQLYMTLSRSLLGKSFGEWSFDLQMGSEAQQSGSLSYPFKICLRNFITALTGFVTLPLLSAILRTDATALLTGIELQRSEEHG